MNYTIVNLIVIVEWYLSKVLIIILILTTQAGSGLLKIFY